MTLRLLSALLLLGAACIAPLSRTTELKPGIGLEFGGGLSVYRGTGVVRDSSALFGLRAQLQDVNVGPYAATRVGYGFGRQYGADLTVAAGYGPALRAAELPGSWLSLTVAGKYRPWRSNNLFFLELGYPQLAVGWVGGFPMHRPNERFSLTVKTGSAVDTLPLSLSQEEISRLAARLLPPTMLQLNAAWNATGRRRGFRISPSIGLGIGFDVLERQRPALSLLTAGVTVAP